MSSVACASVGARRAWDEEPAGVSDGGSVRPSEGCIKDACCSFPAGPVAALAAGDEKDGVARRQGSSEQRGWRGQPGAQRGRGKHTTWRQ